MLRPLIAPIFISACDLAGALDVHRELPLDLQALAVLDHRGADADRLVGVVRPEDRDLRVLVERLGERARLDQVVALVDVAEHGGVAGEAALVVRRARRA
jgi:hypothetical protein